jgi:hypothetical protein
MIQWLVQVGGEAKLCTVCAGKKKNDNKRYTPPDYDYSIERAILIAIAVFLFLFIILILVATENSTLSSAKETTLVSTRTRPASV